MELILKTKGQEDRSVTDAELERLVVEAIALHKLKTEYSEKLGAVQDELDAHARYYFSDSDTLHIQTDAGQVSVQIRFNDKIIDPEALRKILGKRWDDLIATTIKPKAKLMELAAVEPAVKACVETKPGKSAFKFKYEGQGKDAA